MLMSGARYKESLNDGRRVYINGEQVLDLANHPVLAIPARQIAEAYDRHYRAEVRAMVAGGRTERSVPPICGRRGRAFPPPRRQDATRGRPAVPEGVRGTTGATVSTVVVAWGKLGKGCTLPALSVAMLMKP